LAPTVQFIDVHNNKSENFKIYLSDELFPPYITGAFPRETQRVAKRKGFGILRIDFYEGGVKAIIR